MAPIRSSDVWDWTCSWRTVAVTSARMARSPDEVSVTRTPVGGRPGRRKAGTAGGGRGDRVRARVAVVWWGVGSAGRAEDRGADREVRLVAHDRLKHALEVGG